MGGLGIYIEETDIWPLKYVTFLLLFRDFRAGNQHSCSISHQDMEMISPRELVLNPWGEGGRWGSLPMPSLPRYPRGSTFGMYMGT